MFAKEISGKLVGKVILGGNHYLSLKQMFCLHIEITVICLQREMTCLHKRQMINYLGIT